jgi:hypothetical protein
MKYQVSDIKFDTDGIETDLATNMIIEVDDEITDKDEIEEFISDEISNQTGYCHFGFTINNLEE